RGGVSPAEEISLTGPVGTPVSPFLVCTLHLMMMPSTLPQKPSSGRTRRSRELSLHRVCGAEPRSSRARRGLHNVLSIPGDLVASVPVLPATMSPHGHCSVRTIGARPFPAWNGVRVQAQAGRHRRRGLLARVYTGHPYGRLSIRRS